PSGTEYRHVSFCRLGCGAGNPLFERLRRGQEANFGVEQTPAVDSARRAQRYRVVEVAADDHALPLGWECAALARFVSHTADTSAFENERTRRFSDHEVATHSVAAHVLLAAHRGGEDAVLQPQAAAEGAMGVNELIAVVESR
ncbi:MAG TPA: hypothetical protein VEQ58_20740, partial [Polyangiaceae bacterium]|nr:hypothetical protein [Polyangiaceae bacterium]